MFFGVVVCFTGEAQHNAITGIMTFGDIESLDYVLIGSPSGYMALLEVQRGANGG